MKLNLAIISVASLTSGAYAAGNLRSGQKKNLANRVDEEGRDDHDEVNRHLVEETLQVQQNINNDEKEASENNHLDGTTIRFLDEAEIHERMSNTVAQHDDEENNDLPAATTTLHDRNMQSWEFYDEEEYSKPVQVFETNYDSQLQSWGTCPTGSIGLTIRFMADAFPTQNKFRLYNRRTGNPIWESGKLLPKRYKAWMFSFVKNNYANLEVIDTMGDGVTGDGYLSVWYGNNDLYNGQNFGYGLDMTVGMGSCMVEDDIDGSFPSAGGGVIAQDYP